MENYRSALIITFIVVVALLAFAFWPSKQDTPHITPHVDIPPIVTPQATSSALTATVVYSDRGFTPAIVEIAVGGSVTFKNESDRDMWVASDEHPKHLLYPEFDAKRGYEPSGEFTFTFDKAGTWTYHDHLKASLGGTVVVK